MNNHFTEEETAAYADLMRSSTYLMLMAMREGKFTLANTLFQKMLKSAKIAGDTHGEGLTLISRARLLRYEGRLGQAKGALERASKRLEGTKLEVMVAVETFFNVVACGEDPAPAMAMALALAERWQPTEHRLEEASELAPDEFAEVRRSLEATATMYANGVPFLRGEPAEAMPAALVKAIKAIDARRLVKAIKAVDARK